MILQGRLLHDPHRLPTPGWIVIAGDRITDMGEGSPPGKPDLGDPSTLICPGFIDAHVHLPQFDSIGCDGLELMAWLDKVIYPAEARWHDPAFALRQIQAAFRSMLQAGTLGFAGYLTSHTHALEQVLKAASSIPLRGMVGQSLMDRHAPSDLLNQRMAPLKRASRMIASVNPRYAVSCSDRLLSEASALAAESKAFVQTHLAESDNEILRVRQLFPKDESYTTVYDRHGLLTPMTLLAHCVHLEDDEWQLIAKRQAVVVHCPAANTFLKSGMFDLFRARKHGIRLALGSDIAAGPDTAMPRVARAMIETNKFRAMDDPKAFVPTPADAWRIITRGNADVLGWHDAGRLEIGASADVLLLQPPFEIDEYLIGRLIYTWRDDYIAHRILAGQLIHA